MTSPRAEIRMDVGGASQSRREINSVRDALRGMNETSLGGIVRQIDVLDRSFSALRSTVGGALAGLAGGLSFGAVTQQLVSAQREFDKLNASLITATGSVNGAAAAYKSLQAFASTTPYSVAEATEAFIKMKNLGLDPSEAALRSYGNTAAAMGKDLNQMVEAVADAAGGEFDRLKEFGIKSNQEGEKVSLTFRGVTTSIGNNANEIQLYLKKLGEVEFAGAMERRAQTLDGAISGLADSWDALKLSLAQSVFGEGTQDGVRKLASALGTIGDSIGLITNTLATATKIGAAYFAIFTIAPAAYTAVAAAVTRLTGALAIYAMNVAIGQANTIGLNTSLFGTSVAAQLAAGSLSKLALAGSVLFAAFAGWQLGSWLSEEFQVVRLAGLTMVGVLLTGWEKVKYGAEMAWEGIKFSWDNKLGLMKEAFGTYLEYVAKGLGMVGATDTSKSVMAFAQSLKSSGAVMEEYKRRTAAITAAHQKAVAAIDQNIVELMAAEMATKKSSAAQGEANTKTAQATTATVAQTNASKKLLAVQQQAADFEREYSAALSMTGDILAQRVRDAEAEAVRNEELARTYGMSKLAIEQEELARLESQLAQRTSLGLTETEVASLEKLIAAKKRNAAAVGAMEQVDAANKAREEWKRTADSIEQSLTDALMRGFESGKGFGSNLVDTIRNMFNTLVLRPIVSAVVNPISGAILGGLGLSGTAQAASGGISSGIGSAVGAGLGIGGAMSAFGGTLATGFMNTIAGTGLSAGLTAGGAMIGGGSIASGLGMIAGALGPIALGIGAAVAIWKKLDTSGTKHTGAASYADASGVRSVNESMFRMADIADSAQTKALTDGLAQGVVKILDSTATAFGKQAGYSAATAFADDTSKDGAWGALLIKSLGQTVVDWNQTRTSKWAPKEFANGEAGQEQYLAALGASVRTALDGIGLPSWATEMLDKLGSGASLEELAKVVDTINATQGALKRLGDAIAGIAALDGAATSALMKASGGVEALTVNASAYYDAFYTDAEKSQRALAQMTEELKSVGVVLPETREEYRKQVDAALALGEAGAPTAAILLRNAQAFAQLHPQIEAVTGALSGKDLVGKLDAAERAYAEAVASVSDIVRGLYERVQSTQEAVLGAQNEISRAYFAAQDAKLDAEKRVIELQRQAARETAAFGGSIKAFLSSLNTGDLGSASSADQLLSLKAKLSSTAVLAQGGDKDARGALVQVAQDLLRAQRDASGNRAQFAVAEAQVKSILQAVAATAAQQAGTVEPEVDPLVQAQQEVVAAQKRLIEYASLAAITGASTDRASQSTAGSVAALLKAYNEAKGENTAAVTEYQTALQLTSGLALTSSNNLSALGAALERVSNAQVDVITARNDLVEYAKDIGKDVGSIDKTIEAMRKQFGTLETNAGTLATNAGTLATNTGNVATNVGTLVTNAGILATNAGTLATNLGLVGTAAQTLQGILNSVKYTPPPVTTPAPPTSGPSELSEVEQYVARMYNEVLARVPDAGGLDFWADAIKDGVIQFSDAARQIALSAAQMDPSASHSADWNLATAMADKEAAVGWLRKIGVPGFASGGLFGGGLRIVGENGPELEATGPARIWNASQTRAMFSGGGSDNSELVAEIRALRTEVQQLRSANERTASSSETTARVLRSVTRDGEAMQTEEA